ISSSDTGRDLQQHCSGLIYVSYMNEGNQFVDRNQENMATFRHLSERSENEINASDFYEALDAMGQSYGPQFRNLDHIFVEHLESCATLRIPEMASASISSFERPHVIHPAVLDSMFHVAFGVLI